jgi:hypothetical protein
MLFWKLVFATVISVGVVIDGIGSILWKNGQYHNVWFDGERYIRALGGAVLVYLLWS